MESENQGRSQQGRHPNDDERNFLVARKLRIPHGDSQKRLRGGAIFHETSQRNEPVVKQRQRLWGHALYDGAHEEGAREILARSCV